MQLQVLCNDMNIYLTVELTSTLYYLHVGTTYY